MGKKRMAIIGSADEAQQRQKSGVKREQKKIREGKTAKAPGLAGGQRVVDTTAESLREYAVIQAKIQKSQEIKDQEDQKPSRKSKKSKVRSKNYQTAKAQVNPETKYLIPDAIKLLRDISYSKTNDTVELHITLKEKGLATEVELPHSTGRVRRVAIADETTLTKIAAGQIDFDILLASPADMSSLIKYAKILGPKGLMPNPKNGTVVEDPVSAKSQLESATSVNLKPDKDGLAMHLVVGKLAQPDSQLLANINAVFTAILSAKISKAVLKSTMSPAIRLAAYTIN